MARIVFFILLLLNLLAAAGLAGLLGAGHARGEPERLTNQLRPDAIQLLAAGEVPPAVLAADKPAPPKAPPMPPPAEPPAALPPPPPPEPEPQPAAVIEPPAPVVPQACLRFVELSEAQAKALTEMAEALPDALQLAASAELRPSSWWVHVPPQGDRAAAERKVAEIRGHGVTDLFILQDEGVFQWAISLGLFKTEASAKLHLSRLEAKGVRGGTITARGSTVHRIEMRGPADVLATLASDTDTRFEDLSRESCEP